MAIKMIKVKDLAEKLESQILAHSIYIWAASGQLCKDISESWIRKKEARSDGGSHADLAVKKWKEVMAGPYKDVARAFDCSGYVSWCLLQLGALDHRRDCDGIYSKCEKVELTSTPRDGTFLFRVSKSNTNDETHVGVYYGGYQYHAKGRAYGVVKEKFKKSYWAKAGWYKYLEKEDPQPTPVPPEPGQYVFTRVLKYGCKGDDVIELKKLLIAHGYNQGITTDTKSSQYFRSSTRKMVLAYQKDNSLQVDGKAGPETITSLGGIYEKV